MWTACPPRSTRSPSRVTRTVPPRAEHWNPSIWIFRSFSPQVRPEAAVGQPGDRVLRYPDGRRKEPGDEVEMREVGGCRDNDPPGRDRGQRRHVGLEGADVCGGRELGKDVEPVPPDVYGSDSQRPADPGDHDGPVTGSAGKLRVIQSPSLSAVSVPDFVSNVTGDPGSAWPAVQRTYAAASVAWPQRSTSRPGGEPPQVPALLSLMQECRLGVLHLTGHLLHPGRVGRPVQDTDRGGVPAERGPGEGIHQMQLGYSWEGRLYPGTIKDGESGNEDR